MNKLPELISRGFHQIQGVLQTEKAGPTIGLRSFYIAKPRRRRGFVIDSILRVPDEFFLQGLQRSG